MADTPGGGTTIACRCVWVPAQLAELCAAGGETLAAVVGRLVRFGKWRPRLPDWHISRQNGRPRRRPLRRRG